MSLNKTITNFKIRNITFNLVGGFGLTYFRRNKQFFLELLQLGKKNTTTLKN